MKGNSRAGILFRAEQGSHSKWRRLVRAPQGRSKARPKLPLQLCRCVGQPATTPPEQGFSVACRPSAGRLVEGAGDWPLARCSSSCSLWNAGRCKLRSRKKRRFFKNCLDPSSTFLFPAVEYSLKKHHDSGPIRPATGRVQHLLISLRISTNNNNNNANAAADPGGTPKLVQGPPYLPLDL